MLPYKEYTSLADAVVKKPMVTFASVLQMLDTWNLYVIYILYERDVTMRRHQIISIFQVKRNPVGSSTFNNLSRFDSPGVFFS